MSIASVRWLEEGGVIVEYLVPDPRRYFLRTEHYWRAVPSYARGELELYAAVGDFLCGC
jgi:hypothetical protein